MSDELLFILIALADLVVMLLMWKMGRRWLELFIILNYIFASLFVQKFSPVFGITTTITACFYAAIFLGTDIITEHFGKKAGYRLIWQAFFAVLALTVVQQLVLELPHTPETATMAGAMDTLFSAVPRVTAASLFTFLVVQRFDIWLYHWIHKKTKGAHLWLRNIVSTATSQLIDTVMFFGLAFYGLMPLEVLIQIGIVGYIVKLIVALADTPFIYLSYWVKGKKLSESQHIPE
jgi:uncharacterized integral membrane protein (TIGR00697 family)